MSQQQKKIEPGFIGGLFLLATLVLFFFHTKPTFTSRKALETQISQTREQLRLLKEGTSGISTSGEDGALSEVERKQLEGAIPPNMQQDMIVTDLNRIAKASGVSFGGLAFNLQSAEGLQAVTISASFQGGTSDIGRFLKLIEVNPRKFVVKNAGVSRGADDQKSAVPFVTLNITLQAYFQNEL